jgi:hypothetical protein
MTATEDFFVTANAGEWLEHDPLPDGHPSGDGLVAIADRPSLFTSAGEADLVIGTDGDDGGHLVHHHAVADMLDSGHGFLVRKIDEPKTVWRVTCEVCDGPLPSPGDDPDWLCQYYDENQPASLTCNCPWCLKYQDYLAGVFKPEGGRPRQRCGSKACDRKADAERKARTRLKDRRKRLAAEAGEALAEFYAMPEPEPSAGFVPLTLEDVPEGIREAVRAKLNARLDFMSGKPPY